MNNGFQRVNEQAKPIETPKQRPEMKGPATSDIDNILSGLKTRSINIQDHSKPSTQMATGDDSMISIGSLNDIQNSNVPKRSNRRRNKSDKNTISLDI